MDTRGYISINDAEKLVIFQLLNYACYPIGMLPDNVTIQDIIADELKLPVEDVAATIDNLYKRFEQ